MKEGKLKFLLLALLLPFLGIREYHALAMQDDGVTDISLIDTLWPVRVWSMPWREQSFPCEIFEAEEQPLTCIIKGFTVDERERFYVMGGVPNVSIACYEGERQVWRRQMNYPLEHSIYGLMKVKGDSIYFLDEERFRLRRMHRDGHGKVGYADLQLSPDDSLIWACVYEDRFRLQVVNRHNVKCNWDKIVARTRVVDVYFGRRLQQYEEHEVSFNHDSRHRMYGGEKGGDVVMGFDFDYTPYLVRTEMGDTIREVRSYGAWGLSALTSISEMIWGTVMPASINARQGNYLYVPSFTYDSNKFIVLKYDARPLWRWMKEAGIE